MLQSIETENLLSRVCELLSYDSSAPLIFNRGLFLYLFVGFLSIYLLLLILGAGFVILEILANNVALAALI